MCTEVVRMDIAKRFDWLIKIYGGCRGRQREGVPMQQEYIVIVFQTAGKALDRQNLLCREEMVWKCNQLNCYGCNGPFHESIMCL